MYALCSCAPIARAPWSSPSGLRGSCTSTRTSSWAGCPGLRPSYGTGSASVPGGLAAPGSADLCPVSRRITTAAAASATTAAPMLSRLGRAAIRVRIEREILGERGRLHPAGGGRDHRGVVRAQLGRRDVDGHAEGGGALSQEAVRGDAAADGQPRLRLQGALHAGDQRLDDRVLVARRQVGGEARGLLLPELAHLVEQRGLQAREREVEPGDPRCGRELERARVAGRRELRERRAARIAESEQPRALVERLAGRVVERLPHRLVAPVVAD